MSNMDEAAEEEVVQEAAGHTDRSQQTLPDAFPGCKTCGGKGWREWKATDRQTGEVLEEGTEPCPECSQPKTSAKKPDEPPPGDLFTAG